MIEAGDAHVMLLQFVAAEYHELFRVVFLQHDLDEFLAE